MAYVGRKLVEPSWETKDTPDDLRHMLEYYGSPGLFFELDNRNGSFKIYVTTAIKDTRSYINVTLVGPMMGETINVDRLLNSQNSPLNEALGFSWDIVSRGIHPITVNEPESIILWNAVAMQIPSQFAEYIDNKIEDTKSHLNSEIIVTNTALSILDIISFISNTDIDENLHYEGRTYYPQHELDELSNAQIGILFSDDQKNTIVLSLVSPYAQMNDELIEYEVNPNIILNYISNLDQRDRNSVKIYLYARKGLIETIIKNMESIRIESAELKHIDILEDYNR